jgi:hypothetical protein
MPVKNPYAVRGTLDGQRYDDLRVLIPKSIIDKYQAQGEWNSIIHVRFPISEKTDIVLVTVRRGERAYKERWTRGGQYAATWQKGSSEVI